jgi:hypothetical protein
MSNSIVIDVNKIQAGTSRALLLRNSECTHYPVFNELMEAKGNISDTLEDEMKLEVSMYVASKPDSLKDVETEGDEIDRVSKLKVRERGAFDLVQIMATALKAKREGKTSEAIEVDVQAAVKAFEDRVMTQVELDAHRGPLVVDVDGKRLLLSNMTDLQNLSNLCPELTGEQAGYIIKMGQQAFLADVGTAELMVSLGSKEILYKADDQDSKATRAYVSIANGKVQFVANQQFRSMTLDKITQDMVMGLDDTIISASQVVDITSLKGEKFELGRATGDVPIKVVYSGPGMEKYSDPGMEKYSDLLKQALQETYIPNASEALSQDDPDLNLIIQTARDRGGAFVKTAQEDSQSQERKSSAAEIERRQNIHDGLSEDYKPDRSAADNKANFLHKLNHNKEFMASMMATEYARNTELWKSWKDYDENTKNLPTKDPATSQNKFADATEIYAALEKDQGKRLEFAAAKVAQYLNAQKAIDVNSIAQGEAIKEIASFAVKNPVLGKPFLATVTVLHNMKTEDQVGYNCTLESLVYSSIDKNTENQLKYASSKVLEYTSASNNPSKEAVTRIVSPMLPGLRILDKDADLILRAAKESKGLPLKDRVMKIVDKVRISVGMVSRDIAKVATKVKDERKDKRRSHVEELKAQRSQTRTSQTLGK